MDILSTNRKQQHRKSSKIESMSGHAANMESVPHAPRDNVLDRGNTFVEFTPLSKEEIITSVVAAITRQLRERQGLPPEVEPQVSAFLDKH